MTLDELQLTQPYLELPAIFYDLVDPMPLREPYLISYSHSSAALLGLDLEACESDAFVEVLNGTHLLEGSIPFAMCYAGHQFGHFVPRLGDGRAINLGKYKSWNLQLKGAGQTLYSRQGDGRAVLRSSIREFLMSEAMHFLGIPTTRALGIIGSNEDVARERWEKGAIVLRMSPSWVRFGTFEYFYYSGEHDKLERLLDYVIDESYPHLKKENDAYIRFFEEVVEKTAKLMAQWQSVGFNHGVMNTDNMSIAGLTIDYGPYAMLDDYDSNFICNHTDTGGRYSFGNQPPVGYWNLSMLMRALSPIINIEAMQLMLDGFGDFYSDAYLEIIQNKLGLEHLEKGDLELIKGLYDTLELLQVDFTVFFRELSCYDGNSEKILSLCMYHKPMQLWLEKYDLRLEKNSAPSSQRHRKMKAVNPKYILKNYMLQEAISKAEKGDFSVVKDLLRLVQHPYDEHPEFEHYASVTPNKFKNIKLSCSS
jgi:uncharacterized protein YdiU (UPF0061 family)